MHDPGAHRTRRPDLMMPGYAARCNNATQASASRESMRARGIAASIRPRSCSPLTGSSSRRTPRAISRRSTTGEKFRIADPGKLDVGVVGAEVRPQLVPNAAEHFCLTGTPKGRHDRNGISRAAQAVQEPHSSSHQDQWNGNGDQPYEQIDQQREQFSGGHGSLLTGGSATPWCSTARLARCPGAVPQLIEHPFRGRTPGHWSS
jgi:hypothetical protein